MKDRKKKKSSSQNIYVTKIFSINDGFIILTCDDSGLDKLFDDNTDKKLQENYYYPLIPPQLKANRSVLIFSIDPHIYQHTEDEKKNEIKEQYGWIQENTQ